MHTAPSKTGGTPFVSTGRSASIASESFGASTRRMSTIAPMLSFTQPSATTAPSTSFSKVGSISHGASSSGLAQVSDLPILRKPSFQVGRKMSLAVLAANRRGSVATATSISLKEAPPPPTKPLFTPAMLSAVMSPIHAVYKRRILAHGGDGQGGSPKSKNADKEGLYGPSRDDVWLHICNISRARISTNKTSVIISNTCREMVLRYCDSACCQHSTFVFDPVLAFSHDDRQVIDPDHCGGIVHKVLSTSSTAACRGYVSFSLTFDGVWYEIFCCWNEWWFRDDFYGTNAGLDVRRLDLDPNDASGKRMVRDRPFSLSDAISASSTEYNLDGAEYKVIIMRFTDVVIRCKFRRGIFLYEVADAAPIQAMDCSDFDPENLSEYIENPSPFADSRKHDNLKGSTSTDKDDIETRTVAFANSISSTADPKVIPRTESNVSIKSVASVTLAAFKSAANYATAVSLDSIASSRILMQIRMLLEHIPDACAVFVLVENRMPVDITLKQVHSVYGVCYTPEACIRDVSPKERLGFLHTQPIRDLYGPKLSAGFVSYSFKFREDTYVAVFAWRLDCGSGSDTTTTATTATTTTTMDIDTNGSASAVSVPVQVVDSNSAAISGTMTCGLELRCIRESDTRQAQGSSTSTSTHDAISDPHSASVANGVDALGKVVDPIALCATLAQTKQSLIGGKLQKAVQSVHRVSVSVLFKMGYCVFSVAPAQKSTFLNS